MKTTLTANGVALCTETFGNTKDPALLLIHGTGASMDYWETEFCERLAGGGRFVIRYDHRDTGGSVSYPPGAPAYTGDDLLADAVGVLDALGIERAHVVGISMGGALAQRIGLEHPARAASLTLISTTSVGPSDADLPPMSDELRAAFAADAPEPDWTDREQAIDALVADERLYTGSLGYDEPARRAFLGRVIDRTTNLASATGNHALIDGGGGQPRPLSEIAAPTLVLHGTEDPLFPYPHGEALAREIPGARLVPLERAGHELPPPVWDVAIAEILAHTSH